MLFIQTIYSKYCTVIFSCLILVIILFPQTFNQLAAQPGNKIIIVPKTLMDISM